MIIFTIFIVSCYQLFSSKDCFICISSVCHYLQYFDIISGVAEKDLSFYGGSVEIADFCPFSQEFSWHLSGEYQRSSFCRIQENQPGNTSALSILCHPLP